jgi:hypothetical protein
MDHATLLAFAAHRGTETKPTQRDLPRLMPAEQALYDDLREYRLHKNLRLEQELHRLRVAKSSACGARVNLSR